MTVPGGAGHATSAPQRVAKRGDPGVTVLFPRCYAPVPRRARRAGPTGGTTRWARPAAGLYPGRVARTARERAPAEAGDYPGARLGLPSSGRGSVAGWGARLLALLLDAVVAWLAGSAVAALIGIREHGACPAPSLGVPAVCPAVARALLERNLVITATFVLLQVGFLIASGRTPGMRLTALQVVRLDGRVLGWRAVLRTLLLVLLVPPLVTDADRRGLHDRACHTVVVRVR